jgi:kumamolisin
VPALCAAYDFPANLAGGGIIAIVELGGGWLQSDLDAFFQSIGQPTPNVTDISVDGTSNTPGDDSADFEVALDIEVAAAAYYVATGKVAEVRVYWAQDIAMAVEKATEDGCDVCSISWGADEAQWGEAAADRMEAAAAAATAAGMVVFAAAGDNDASDGGDTPANVDVPASCPHVIACGGTSKTATTEVVWDNDPDPADPNGEGTGGGYSTIFPVQSWQIGAPPPPASSGVAPGRMVPDVAANADPNTGYLIYCHGSQTVIGGTSAVAPLYAGLFAAFGKKLGWIAPKLWANASCFTDITVGGNGLFSALKGPDACTGLGVPIGTKLAALFGAAPAPPAPSPPPPPAPSGPTLAEVEQAVAKAYAGHFVLDRFSAIVLAKNAIATLLSATTTPSLAAADAALSKAFGRHIFMLRSQATALADAALAPLW